MRETTEAKHPQLAPKGIARDKGGENPVLLGGRCAPCDRVFFPRPQFCPHCLEPVGESELKGEGEVYSYTAVKARPPLGLPQPYALGYIDLTESGLRVFALLDPADLDGLALGAKVALTIGPMGKDAKGEPCLRPFFRLIEREAEHG